MRLVPWSSPAAATAATPPTRARRYAGLFTNVVFGFLIAYILLAVYDETVSIGGYDVEDAIAYVWISQGLLSVAGLFGPGWWELARRVQTGDVATDLQRPLDVQHAGFAEDAGRAGYQLLWRAVPQFLLGVAPLRDHDPRRGRALAALRASASRSPSR